LTFAKPGCTRKRTTPVFLAAAPHCRLARQSDSAGLTFSNDEIRQTFPPAGSLDGLRPLLLALEEIKPSGRSQIETDPPPKRRKIRRRSLVILISTLLQTLPASFRIQHLRHNKP